MRRKICCHLEYFRNSEVLESLGKIIGCEKKEADKLALHLDKTPFYPGGGGQPCDIGTISLLSDNNFLTGTVDKVKGVEVGEDETIIQHECSFTSPVSESALIGQEVKLAVDPQQRLFHCRLHTAGHIIDAALLKLNLPWKASKAYHYPDSPYVQYEGDLTMPKDELVKKLQELCEEMIKQDLPVLIEFENDDPNDTTCLRSMRIADLVSIPCGGTHVRSLGEVGPMTVRKIETKKGIFKVCYTVPK